MVIIDFDSSTFFMFFFFKIDKKYFIFMSKVSLKKHKNSLKTITWTTMRSIQIIKTERLIFSVKKMSEQILLFWKWRSNFEQIS